MTSDLAFLPRHKVPEQTTEDIRLAIEDRLGRSADCVDLLRATPVLACQVIETGSVILDPDPAGRARFEGLVYSSYARLNEERSGILADSIERGFILAR